MCTGKVRYRLSGERERRERLRRRWSAVFMRPSGYLGLVVEELFFSLSLLALERRGSATALKTWSKPQRRGSGDMCNQTPRSRGYGGGTDAKLKVEGVRAVSQVLFLHKLSPPAVFGTLTQPRGGKNYAIDGLYLRALSVSGYLFCPLLR